MTKPRFNSCLDIRSRNASVPFDCFFRSDVRSILHTDYRRCVWVGICKRWMEKNAKRRASLYSQYLGFLPLAFVVVKRENSLDFVTVLPPENVYVSFLSYCGFVKW